MAGGRQNKVAINLAERRHRAIELRKTGASYRLVAELVAQEFTKLTGKEYKYAESQAYNDIKFCLQEINEHRSLATEEYRALELSRLDTAQLAIAQQVAKGHLGAVDRWLKISERRAKLLGLDAPDRIKVVAEVEKELEQVVNLLEARLPTEIFDQVINILATDTIAQTVQAANE